jgi:hypothetical protein
MATTSWTLPPPLPRMSDVNPAPLSAPAETLGQKSETSQGINPSSIFSPGYSSDVNLAPAGRGISPDDSTSSCSDTPPSFSEEVSSDTRMDFPFAPMNGTPEPILLPT